jgi:hypothetical protein
VDAPKKRKKRKDAKPTGSKAAPSATSRKRQIARSEVAQEPEKPRTWLRSGWCQDAHATAAPVAHHGRCKHIIETPSSIAVCPCLCHVAGVIDLLDTALKAGARRAPKQKDQTPPNWCPKCNAEGRKVKKGGLPFWKCENGHRWPR